MVGEIWTHTRLQHGAVIVVAIEVDVSAVGDGKGQAAVNLHNGVNVPAVEEPLGYNIVASVIAHIPQARHHELVALVVIGAAPLQAQIGEVLGAALGGVVLQLHALEGLAVGIEAAQAEVVPHSLGGRELDSVITRGLVGAHEKNRAKGTVLNLPIRTKLVGTPLLDIASSRNRSKGTRNEWVVEIHREGQVMTQ